MVEKFETLHLFMNREYVGRLIYEKTGIMSLQYDKSWLHNPNARPISLSLPLREKKYSGQSVYNYFDNLLPDSNQIRARIQAKFQFKNSDPFTFLKKIGADCIGAIQLTNEKKITNIKNINSNPISGKEISKILKEYKNYPLGMKGETDDFRISLAGVQEKTAFTLINNKWHRPIGATPTTHIFKRPIGIIKNYNLDLSESCENEWLCLKILKAFDIPVANAVIEYFEDEKVLVIERFDRKFSVDGSWIIRLPMEDICQALGYSPHLKYESDGGPGIINIMNLLLGSRKAKYDRKVFLKSQVLFWLLAAIDGHAKNFSIFLESNNRYSLAPLYDVMSAYPYIASGELQKQKIKMAMALRSKNVHYRWYNIRPKHFLSIAKKVGYSENIVKEIIREIIANAYERLLKVESDLPKDFPTNISDSIFSNFKYNLKKTEQL